MESVMNLKQVISLSALALAAGAALADEGPLTRAEVRNDVLAARAAGTLMPAGQGAEPGYVSSGPSIVARSQIKLEARQVYATKARSIHEFESAGNNLQALDYARQAAAPSTITRTEMKSATLAARSQGELMGAGEEGYPAGNPELHAASESTKVHDFVASIRSNLVGPVPGHSQALETHHKIELPSMQCLPSSI
jgi:hypothetical protein